MSIDREEIARLTLEYGGDWGIDHAKRLIHLVSILGEGMEYDSEAVWLAAYLHDWGGYERWMVQGVDHWTRSAEVAREFLAERGCPADLLERVVECIENHHGGSPNRGIESRLFTDADALDLLGVVGALRIFAMNPRSIRNGYAATKRYFNMSTAALSTDKGKELAKPRIAETEEILRKFEEETFGIF